MHDTLDFISINAALRVLRECEGKFDEIELYFGVNPDEVAIPVRYLTNCFMTSLDMLQHGLLDFADGN